MVASIKWIGVGALVLIGGVVSAQAPGDAAVPQEPRKLVEGLSAVLKERLARALPPQIVFAKEIDWGHQAQIPSLQGLTPITVRRNHGDWEKSRAIARDVPQRLSVKVGGITSTGENHIRFAMHLSLPADLELRQQIWQNGLQVYASHIRSRFQLSALLEMEADLQPVAEGANPPENALIRLRLVRGTYACDRFVAENVNGLGGDFARLLDSGAGRSFRPWQPAMLNEFQNTITNALGPVCDASEVRTCLSGLVLHANSVRTRYLQSQATVLAPAVETIAPPAVPLFVGSSFEFEFSNVGRMSVPHVEHVLVHPGLTNAAIHVAHAALVAASHVHIDPGHKK